MKHFFITAIIYFILLIPMKYGFSLMPGYEMRGITFLPAVLGIYWGPPAALGVAAANFASDLLAKEELYIAVTGSIANFFQAYIPYKLWYTLWVRKEERVLAGDCRSIFKFAYILLLTAGVVSAMFCMILESSHSKLTAETFLMFFINNFDSSLLFGIPLLVLLTNNSWLKRYIPPKDNIRVREKPYYDVFLYITIFIGIIYTALLHDSVSVDSVYAFLAWSAMFICLVLFAQKPIVYEFEEKAELTNQELLIAAMKKYLVWEFIIIICLTAVFVVGFAYIGISGGAFNDGTAVWRYLWCSLLVAVHAMLVILIGLFYRSEKKLTSLFSEKRKVIK